MQRNIILKKKSVVIANGVALNNENINDHKSIDDLGLDNRKKYVLFLGNKNDVNKNYALAEKAVELMNSEEIVLLAPYPVEHKKVIKYLNAVDVLLLSSFMEGSPNIVKEAMACNCSVVSTNVGDVAWLFGEEPGYFLADFDPADYSKKILKALEFIENNGRPNGRQRLIDLKLEMEDVACKISDLYKTLV